MYSQGSSLLNSNFSTFTFMQTVKVILIGLLLWGCKSIDNKCIDESKINPEAICTMDYTPVCGCNNKTYSNACKAENEGVLKWTDGECPEQRLVYNAAD